MRKTLSIALAAGLMVASAPLMSSSMAAGTLASQLVGTKICFNDGGTSYFGPDGVFRSGGVNSSGQRQGAHGPYTIRGNVVTVRYAGPDAHGAYRVNEITIGPNGTVHEVDLDGRHPNGEKYAGAVYDGSICS